MPLARIPVDVIMERVPVESRWISHKWQPAAVVPAGAPVRDLATEPGPPELLHDGAEGTQWRFPGVPVEMHHVEAEGYYLNVSAPKPAVFVMWRMYDDGEPPARPVIVTLSYNEAARMMDGGEQVDTVAMPAPLLAWLSEFVADNYKPEPKKKQRRNDPFAADADAERTGKHRKA